MSGSRELAGGAVAGYYDFARPEMLAYLPDDCATLLDVGCGAGAFAAAVRAERGAEVWGVEPVAEVAAVAAGRLDRVIAAPFDTGCALPEDYFDVVTFNDSLEHFPDPDPPLALAGRVLKAGGLVVASLPNVRYIENVRHVLIERDWRYEDAGIRDRTHLRFFTRKSLVRTFEEAGYDVLRVEGLNPHPFGSWKIRALRLLFARWMEDMRYLQFAVIARPRRRDDG